MNEVKLVVFGSREANQYVVVSDAIEQGLAELGLSESDITLLIEGEAPGADKLSRRWAEERGIEVKPMPADWNNIDAPGAVVKQGHYGPYNAAAGFWRNQDMANEGTHFIGIRAPGKSNGTDDMRERIANLGKPLSFIQLEE